MLGLTTKVMTFTNYHNIMSDHIMISCSYNNKKIKSTQQFRTIRDYKLLTKDILNEYFSHNDTLNTIFNYTDPELVANILINEITRIINCIAPLRKFNALIIMPHGLTKNL